MSSQHLQANHITKIEVAVAILQEETHYKGKAGAASCQIYCTCFQSSSGEDHLEPHLCLTLSHGNGVWRVPLKLMSLAENSSLQALVGLVHPLDH